MKQVCLPIEWHNLYVHLLAKGMYGYAAELLDAFKDAGFRVPIVGFDQPDTGVDGDWLDDLLDDLQH